ncbi:hypothetical protein CR513_60712, partial [Mucuna pruriens]
MKSKHNKKQNDFGRARLSKKFSSGVAICRNLNHDVGSTKVEDNLHQSQAESLLTRGRGCISPQSRSKEKESERLRKDKSPKMGSFPSLSRKEEKTLPSPVPTSKSNNIKCFKCLGKGHIASHCPNKRSMLIQEDGTIDSKSSRDE